jgi:hypothetical protein
MKWNKMLNEWDSTIKKNYKTLIRRCEKGIPPRVRGQVFHLFSQINSTGLETVGKIDVGAVTVEKADRIFGKILRN